MIRQFYQVWSNYHDIIVQSATRDAVGLLADTKITCFFLTSCLALNERNYEQYKKLVAWVKKKEILEKILIGNVISMSKSLGYTVTGHIRANTTKIKEVPTKIKGTPML
ncbi:MAG: CRISPR-associated endonuclease Cas6 [Thermodesulfovibrionales bacterium]|nr:CRISPR-associated endonuclease Cas6 [Thermodesulfovibrionales bacterium]